MSDNNEYYTVIRVKRKYVDDPNRQDRYDSTVTNKRLRHIGSFSQKHDEISLNSQNLLKKMGFKDRKRIRFNDFDDDKEFSSYINDKQDQKDKESVPKKCKSTNSEQINDENNILNISLPPNDSIDLNQSNTDNKNDHSTITCNGMSMIMADNSNVDESIISRQDKYLYDYYILMDDLMEFVEKNDKGDYDIDGNKNSNMYDDDEPSSNDENYRYNDYPDEDEFSDDEDKEDDDDDDDEECGKKEI
ncbi:female sterile (2) ltoPP43 [Dermatophagoides pteronyssinus]|uniref:female sterile (2) ltoPP43 n=1 Tax=Dermatophagoides pteronyssinus TaxID=6956 RepID=UPI003F67C3EF